MDAYIICIYNTVQPKSSYILYIYRGWTILQILYVVVLPRVSLFLSARRHGANVAVDILDSKTKRVTGSNDPFDGEVATCTHDRRYKIFERY